MANVGGAGPLLRPAQMRALTGSVGWSYSPRIRAIPTGSPLGRVLEFPHGPALQDGGAALMSRPSRTTSIIVAGLLVVGCEASHSPRSASQVASHPPAAAEASGSAPSVSQVASHPPAAGEASKSSPSASPFPAAGEDTAALDAGRYVTSDPFPIPVSVTVPAGWVSEEPGPFAVFLSTADGVGNDGPACSPPWARRRFPPPGGHRRRRRPTISWRRVGLGAPKAEGGDGGKEGPCPAAPGCGRCSARTAVKLAYRRFLRPKTTATRLERGAPRPPPPPPGARHGRGESAGRAARGLQVERVTGIEPAWPAWKAGALPLSYTRVLRRPLRLPRTRAVRMAFEREAGQRLDYAARPGA